MTDTSAPPEQIAQGIVREWAEHDLDEHYDSEYMRDTLHSAELEERISIALTPPPAGGVRRAAEEIIGQLGVKGKPIEMVAGIISRHLSPGPAVADSQYCSEDDCACHQLSIKSA
jgi:hypothetical protein